MPDWIAFVAGIVRSSLRILIGLTIAAASIVFLVDHTKVIDDAALVKQIHAASWICLLSFASLSLVGIATASYAFFEPKVIEFFRRRDERLMRRNIERDEANAARTHLWGLDERALLYLAWMLREGESEGFYRGGNVVIRQLANRGFLLLEYGKVDLNDQKVTVPGHIWSVLVENRDRLLNRNIPIKRPDSDSRDNSSAWTRI